MDQSPRMLEQPLLTLRQNGEVDCETAAIFRACLRPHFETAKTWGALIQALSTKGYGLAIREGRLVLTERATDERVCTVRYLGTSLRELASRLGRPHVIARRDNPAAADFMV